MSIGAIAGLISAGVFALLVLLLAVPIMRLGQVLDEVRIAIRSLSDGAIPIMDGATVIVATANQQLRKVDGIASNVSDVSADFSALTSLVTASVGAPLIRMAAFSHGVRTALAKHPMPATGRRSR
ncbi:DUF948 domain-containing protein [Arthrobacter sp. NicSoilC5]|uniref:DUF948 domain-containing protein n=1 Tax=Arthrobacter sp. NicSoilC5 TaxID=2831000 RepID=UPI001CC5D9F0|nr:DUF948 domain-containing protein [Arthrobacter sp. NicSoilC5]BCW78226.1 hypothetical protein NicSoilC5_02450 [Arthrobacter sp. NicSoilC5]